MRKTFKSKKNKKRGKELFFLFVLIFSFAISLSFFSSFFQKESVLEFLIDSTLYTKNNSILKKSTSIFDFLLDYTIGQKEFQDEIYDGSTSPQEYTPDPTPTENKTDPIIYLYNTHQGEEYLKNTLEEHDVTPTVMLASYKLRELLNKKGLNTIVETNPISEVLKINSWNYASSYKASRYLIEDAKKENPTLKFFFDIHRDAIPYESSVISYNGKDYAKILFVIGTDHENFESNLSLATKINTLLKSKVPEITRGISKKGGSGVNGIYNQDNSPTTLLFELGGQYNKISEVNNTLLLLADVLEEVVKSYE